MPPQRRYICSFCARAFSRSEHRARHERSHTKEKPFTCDRCPSAFVRRDLLQRHLRTVHSKDKGGEPTAAATSIAPSASVVAAPSDSFLTHSTEVEAATSPQTTLGSAVTTPPRSPSLASTCSQPSTPTHSHTHNSILSIDGSQLYRFNEKNIISLLTLSKKFNKLRYLELNSKISSSFLVWGTVSNLNLPIVKSEQVADLDENSSLLYALLAFGSADSAQFEDCVKLLTKSWLLILKASSSNNSPLEILQPLTILAYVYLMHYPVLRRLGEVVPMEIVLDYLDQTIVAVLQQGDNHEEPLFDYWHVFRILSNFSLLYNRKPSTCHRLFLEKLLPSSAGTLNDALELLSKSPVLPNDPQSCDCIIMALANELQALRFSQPNLLQTRNALHNAVIMTNKCLLRNAQLDEQSTDTLRNLLLISKRNLLLSCPLRLQDLVSDYATVPRSAAHWHLLHVTLKEFNFEQGSAYNQISELHTTDEVSVATVNYVKSLTISEINNNLGLVSLPVLFLGFLSSTSTSSDLQSVLNVPLNNFALFVIENYLTLVKLFTSLNSFPETFLNNAIVQSIVFLISEMGTTTSQQLQDEISLYLSSPTTSHVSDEFVKYFVKNLDQNLNLWLSQTYSRSNKLELLDGIHSAISEMTGTSVSSPIQSGSTSPKMYKSQSGGSSYSSSSSVSNGLSSFERITLPPITLPKLSTNEPRMLPVPTTYPTSGHFRYGF